MCVRQQLCGLRVSRVSYIYITKRGGASRDAKARPEAVRAAGTLGGDAGRGWGSQPLRGDDGPQRMWQ